MKLRMAGLRGRNGGRGLEGQVGVSVASVLGFGGQLWGSLLLRELAGYLQTFGVAKDGSRMCIMGVLQSMSVGDCVRVGSCTREVTCRC
jgi:hypothetical protein